MSNQSQAGKPEHRLDFFRPNQIAFLVTHQPTADQPVPDDHLPEGILRGWADTLNRRLSENDLSEKGWRLAADKPLRSYSFPEVSDDESANVPEEDQDEKIKDPFSIIVSNVERNGFPSEPVTTEDRVEAKLALLELISTLDQGEERKRMTSAFPVLPIQAVFPNWVASSSKSDSGGTGGPGSEPVPYRGDPGPIPYYFKELIDKLQTKSLYGSGDGVDVVILDTAPSGHDLVLAHKELVLLRQGNQKHPLLKDLLGPSGRLKLYPATYEELLRMGNTSLNKHGYKMEDHGLFIAAIIHSIVPDATIHLIEVLNPFGVGDLETIALGFEKAFAIFRRNRKPLVVNCSLVLDLPHKQKGRIYRPTNKESINKLDRDVEAELRKNVEREIADLTAQNVAHPEDEVRWVISLGAICERLAKAGRQVVAAAGNDSEERSGQRDAQDARYPAAFSKVMGVGSLPKDSGPDNNGKYKASTFSNLADKPAKNGVMALGGEPGEMQGVLGVYLGEFPPSEDAAGQPINGQGWPQSGPKSTNGWAWWAGTSFATPVLTGVIASVLSQLGNAGKTQHAVEALYTEHIIEDDKTYKKEDVLPSSLIQDFKPNE